MQWDVHHESVGSEDHPHFSTQFCRAQIEGVEEGGVAAFGGGAAARGRVFILRECTKQRGRKKPRIRAVAVPRRY